MKSVNEEVSYEPFGKMKDDIIKRCDYWYDNYRFNEEVTHTIYNSDMIFYYLYHLIREITKNQIV